MTILQWMEQRGIKPYSEGNELAEAIPLAFRHLGDVATGKRPCSRWVAERLVEITNGEISYDDLFGKHTQPNAQAGQQAEAAAWPPKTPSNCSTVVAPTPAAL